MLEVRENEIALHKFVWWHCAIVQLRTLEGTPASSMSVILAMGNHKLYFILHSFPTATIPSKLRNESWLVAIRTNLDC